MTKTIKLTTKFIETFEPAGKTTVVWDVMPTGFGVRFYKSGKIAFIVQKRVGSGRLAKQRKMTIGTYPEINLVRARTLALEAIAKFQMGGDPVQEEVDRQEEARLAKAAELSVAELTERWLATDALRSRMRGPRFGTLRKAKDVRSNANQIKRHVIPLIGTIKLSDVTRKTIMKMQDDIAAGKTAKRVKTGPRGIARVTGGEGTAGKAVRLMGTIFNYAVREGLLDKNPASNIPIAPSRKVERYLSTEEQARLEAVLQSMENIAKYEKGCAMIRVLMLTGCRKNEIETLKWSDIDFERGFVKFSKSKTGAKVIPFARAALDIIEAQPRLNSTPYVFPSTKINDYYKGIPKIWLEVRKRAKIEDCRLHDLRHNFASIAASNGASLPMIGALLGHTQAQTTARYAHLTRHSLHELAEQVSATIGERSGSVQN
ncbi:tyrosine-type recombinase/integrase [Hyphomonas sp.]|uniref:tyrosine-type recombinase/integrase n=1 Tax=Hyphomonas sp. TaxID=87 RepID=UPI0025BAE8C9|nr:tyrosine-type recombinase/integrase [Hyphomonas sp.]